MYYYQFFPWQGNHKLITIIDLRVSEVITNHLLCGINMILIVGCHAVLVFSWFFEVTRYPYLTVTYVLVPVVCWGMGWGGGVKYSWYFLFIGYHVAFEWLLVLEALRFIQILSWLHWYDYNCIGMILNRTSHSIGMTLNITSVKTKPSLCVTQWSHFVNICYTFLNRMITKLYPVVLNLTFSELLETKNKRCEKHGYICARFWWWFQYF